MRLHKQPWAQGKARHYEGEPSRIADCRALIVLLAVNTSMSLAGLPPISKVFSINLAN
jgi:hypothetical protein